MIKEYVHLTLKVKEIIMSAPEYTEVSGIIFTKNATNKTQQNRDTLIFGKQYGRTQISHERKRTYIKRVPAQGNDDLP